jgi:hypothetical protein
MTKFNPLPALERLQEVFALDEQGVLIWKAKPFYCSKVTIGAPAGCQRKEGYIRVKLDKKLYFAHRIVWYLATGVNPGNLQIDHINRIRSDNRPENLRLATNYQNAQNRLDSPRGGTGELCVTFARSKLKPYRVQVKGRYLGVYATLAEARKARDTYLETIRCEFSPA